MKLLGVHLRKCEYEWVGVGRGNPGKGAGRVFTGDRDGRMSNTEYLLRIGRIPNDVDVLK